MVADVDERRVVESRVKRHFVHAPADPAWTEADIVRLSSELRPFGQVDPEAFVISEVMDDSPVKPLCGGRANKGYVLDKWWMGSKQVMALVDHGGGFGQGWWWSTFTDMQQGRPVGPFGSVRVTFDNGYRPG